MKKTPVLYKTPSGMGGTFNVKIVNEDYPDGIVLVKVHSPRNRDWHGFSFTTHKSQLELLPNE